MAGVTDWPSIAAPRRRRRRPVRDRHRGPSPGATSGASRTSAGCGCRRCRPGSAARSAGSCPTGPGSPSPGASASGCTGCSSSRRRPAFSEMIGNLPQIARAHRGDLPGLDLTQPSARAPADVLRVRLVHHRPGRRLVPGRLGERRGPATARGRPVDAALAGELGDAGARSACWRAIGVMAAVIARSSSGSRSRSRAATSSRRWPGVWSWAWRRRRSPSVGLAVGGLVRTSLAAGVTAFLVIATFLIDTLGAALKLPGLGARPVALPAPRPADGGHLRSGRAGRRGGHGRRRAGRLHVRPDAARYRQVTSGGGTLGHRPRRRLGRPAPRLERPAQDRRRSAADGDDRAARRVVRHRAARDRGVVARRGADRCRSRASRSGLASGVAEAGVLHLPRGRLPARRPVGGLSARARDGAAARRRSSA